MSLSRKLVGEIIGLTVPFRTIAGCIWAAINSEFPSIVAVMQTTSVPEKIPAIVVGSRRLDYRVHLIDFRKPLCRAPVEAWPQFQDPLDPVLPWYSTSARLRRVEPVAH
jgi:hypothetical protein